MRLQRRRAKPAWRAEELTWSRSIKLNSPASSTCSPEMDSEEAPPTIVAAAEEPG